MGKLAPVNPRNYLPSRAHPEHRSRRKQLEKEHPFTWKEPLVLGLIGIGLAWNIEKQVQKHEERKEREEQQQQQQQQQGRDDNNNNNSNEQRRRRRRETDPQGWNGSYDGGSRRSRSTRGGGERWGGNAGSEYSVGRDTVDVELGRRNHHHQHSHRRHRRDDDRVQSTGNMPALYEEENPRYIDDEEYYEQARYDRGYYDDDDDDDDAYHESREGLSRDSDWEREYRGRSRRRDSW
ncbi:hypothetical protein F4811DRAFT_521709 [Daldinia bambusicola]|nr:hypothetical protein F4811DRAFT_521709 [Daldinia bambusicola]